jgi:hypothetical protein
MNGQLPNVNVIFHGLYLFVQQRQHIDVLIPNMGDGHVYRAGAFLAEESLEARPLHRPYALTGVSGGDATFDNTKNVVFQNQDFDHDAGPDKVYARIVLPYPAEIRSLRPPVDPIVPVFDPGELFTVYKPADIQVLRYFAADLTKVALFPHTGKLGANPANTFVNLHIIAEEDHEIDDQARDGFDAILALLPGITTSVIFDGLKIGLESDPGDLAAGYSSVELLDLAERNKSLLSPLGSILQSANAESKALGEVFIDIDEPPFDCWAIICDNRRA